MEQIMRHDTATSSRPVAGHYCADEIGAPFKVYLGKGCTVERKHGEEIVSIQDLPGLIAAIVQARLLHPRKLSAADLKFIRTALRVKSKTVADAIELSPEHYSRCETGEKTMSPATEKTYRGFALLSILLRDQTAQEVLKIPRESPSVFVSPKKARKAIAAFEKVFMEMRIEPVARTGEELSFSFSRRNSAEACCGNDDEPEWEQKAA